MPRRVREVTADPVNPPLSAADEALNVMFAEVGLPPLGTGGYTLPMREGETVVDTMLRSVGIAPKSIKRRLKAERAEALIAKAEHEAMLIAATAARKATQTTSSKTPRDVALAEVTAPRRKRRGIRVGVSGYVDPRLFDND